MKTIYDIIETINSKRIITKRKSIVNKGFEKLKNDELKYEFENCMKVKYNPRKHIKLKSLGFKTIYKLDALGKRRWSNYFNSGGRVYLIAYSTKLPLCERIIFDRKIRKFIGKDVPLPLKQKLQKREYVKGGKNGKVLGFNYYFISDQKLLPKHRRLLIERSENYISQIIDEKIKLDPHCFIDISELDSDASDSELVEEWNLFFQKYGYRFKEFEEQWFKLFCHREIEFNSELSKEEDLTTKESGIKPLKFNINQILKPTITNLG